MTLGRTSADGGDPGTFETVGQSLVAIHDWTFLLGPGFIGVVGTGLILGWLMYRSGLVPRWMARLGLVGGPLVCASAIGVLFGVFEAGSAPQVLATAPEFVWELSLGIYLMVKGFKPSHHHWMAAAAPARTTTSTPDRRPPRPGPPRARPLSAQGLSPGWRAP